MEKRLMEKLEKTPVATPNEVIAEPCTCELMKKELTAKENEVSLLHDELKTSEKKFSDIDKKYKDLLVEKKNLHTEYEGVVGNLKNCSSTLELLRVKK